MSYKTGHIINTAAQNSTEYGVVQAPLGLSRTLRKSCAIRGGFSGNTPIDDNKKFDCSGVAPTPPPPPGNEDYWMSNTKKYSNSYAPEIDSGAAVVLTMANTKKQSNSYAPSGPCLHPGCPPNLTFSNVKKQSNSYGPEVTQA